MDEKKILLKRDDLSFSVLSMVDDFGRVFFFGNKVFRAINENQRDYCLSLINSPLFIELQENSLIPLTKISNYRLADTELVLEHERLQEIAQHEWSFDMLKDAALLILRVNEICNRHGYELKDAHTLNVLFRGHHPVLADIGSISPLNSSDNWIAYDEYLGSFVIPLLFWNRKMIYITRKLLESNFHRMVTEPSQSLVDSGLIDLLFQQKVEFHFKFRSFFIFSHHKRIKLLEWFSQKTQSGVKLLTGRKTKVFSYKQATPLKKTLSDYLPYSEVLETLKSTSAPKQDSLWKNYHEKYYTEDSKPKYSQRFLWICDLIKGYRGSIDSIVDLAGNEGYFCKLLSEKMETKKIIVADYDANAINHAYLNLKSSNDFKVHTALLNFMFTPSLNETFKRFKCDLVIAMAITHHLILSQHFSIETIFERIKSYSNRYVLIEFMPLGLWSKESPDSLPDLPPWYNLDWFRERFERYFTVLKEAQLEQNRIVFFGEIKIVAKD